MLRLTPTTSLEVLERLANLVVDGDAYPKVAVEPVFLSLWTFDAALLNGLTSACESRRVLLRLLTPDLLSKDSVKARDADGLSSCLNMELFVSYCLGIGLTTEADFFGYS